MQHFHPLRKCWLPGILVFSLLMVSVLSAQQTSATKKAKFKFTPEMITLGVGETVQVKIELLEPSGNLHDLPFLMYIKGNAARKGVKVTPRTSQGGGEAVATLVGLLPGTYQFAARTITVNRMDRMEGKAKVEVAFPPLDHITFEQPRQRLYVGSTVAYDTWVFDQAGLVRKGVEVSLLSSNPAVATTDDFGNVTTKRTGKATLTAHVKGLKTSFDIEVVKNPVTSIELSGNMTQVRTGDVIQFTAVARDGLGKAVEDAPISFTFMGKPEQDLAPSPAGEVDQSGRFVAETSGYYTIVANSGPHIARQTVHVRPRNVGKKVEVVGHGAVLDVFTSDLWVWQGVDGKDYAITGTWGAKGDAYFWDVSDPSNLRTIDTVRVDARTVNDVKVSEDGKIAVISREGASNRRNGIVILDVSHPADVKVISTYDHELTGGVHNVFIYQDYVFAVNNSIRYDIIDIHDPVHPHRVSRVELDTPGHGVHDVWIQNGIAFSSNWQDGVQLVDIGGVTAGRPFRKFGETASPEISTPFAGGGSPANPIRFAGYEYPSGWNHAAFPYFSESTHKFYVLAGDEAFPYGLNIGKPANPRGWIHFVDFSDPKNSKEVARYEVPEAGSHNFWVEGDVLYAAFYNGGLRVVDISGDLMGDLYKQGREIAWFLPYEANGPIPNSPMVWGPQPYKGLIYFADMNSGLWAVRLVPKPDKGGTN